MPSPRRSASRRARPSSSTPLDAVREIAALLASGQPTRELGPVVLEAARRAVGAPGMALWLREPDGGLAEEWLAGEMEVAAADGDPAGGRVVAEPIVYEGREIGRLVTRLAGADAGAIELLRAVADMLAPTLGVAEYAQRLEDEVRARTQEIERQRRFIARVVDSLPLGLYVVDRNFRVQAWNRNRETGMQGISREEAIGRPIFDVLHRQPAEELRAELQEVFATGEVRQFQTESVAGGKVRIFRITKIPMRLDDGGPVSHVITIGEDVTAWREAQDRIAQAEKLAAIGTVTAGVMHEINNPLATIAACAEATALGLAEASEGEVGPSMRRTLEEAFRLVESEVHRCKRIVDGLLDFSRPRSAEKEPLDLAAVVDRTLFLLTHHPRFKQLAVVVEPRQGPTPLVMASEEQLVQVFMALLLNAMDAMRERGTIVLRLLTDERWVRAEVEDHGEGIRRADLPKIFEPFFTTKPPGRGTGLGLSVCYAIIAEHGGRIEVDSSVGRGSVFRIVLPRAHPT